STWPPLFIFDRGVDDEPTSARRQTAGQEVRTNLFEAPCRWRYFLWVRRLSVAAACSLVRFAGAEEAPPSPPWLAFSAPRPVAMFGLLDTLSAQRKRFTQANQARDSACP